MNNWLIAFTVLLLSQRILCRIDQLIRPGFPELNVVFGGSHKVSFGSDIKPSAATSKPSLRWDADPNALYTVIMIDADAPSRKDPYMSEFVHWLVVNIHGRSVNNADELASYRGPRPPAGTGPHRYYLALFKQQSVIPRKKLESRARTTHANYRIRDTICSSKIVKLLESSRILMKKFGEKGNDARITAVVKGLIRHSQRFDTLAFATEHGLGEPIAGNFFEVL